MGFRVGIEGLADLLRPGETAAQREVFVRLAVAVVVEVVAALHQVDRQLLKRGAGQCQLQMFGAGAIGRDKGQIDLGLRRRRKLDLGFLGGLTQTLYGLAILAEINAVFLLKLGN